MLIQPSAISLGGRIRRGFWRLALSIAALVFVLFLALGAFVASNDISDYYKKSNVIICIKSKTKDKVVYYNIYDNFYVDAENYGCSKEPKITSSDYDSNSFIDDHLSKYLFFLLWAFFIPSVIFVTLNVCGWIVSGFVSDNEKKV